METTPEETSVNKKLLALVGVVLALLLIAICYVGTLLILSFQKPSQPAVAQQAPPITLLPTPVALVEPETQYLPVVVNQGELANQEEPVALSVPISNVWRFISIDEDDVATFENVSDPSQRIGARCVDPNRPIPEKGALYTLDDNGILKPQEGRKKFQRFEPIPMK